MHDNNVPVKELARGQWFHILRCLGGVEERFLNKRNGPCPICNEGTDRFRWKDTDGRGEYFCTKCNPGDGFQLLMKLHSWTYPETARRIEVFLGVRPAYASYKSKPKSDPAIAINKVIRGSRSITKDDEVSQYLEGRGLYGIPQELKFHPELYEPDTKKTFPAMIGMMRDVHGVVVCVHRTYLQAGEKAKINSPRKMMTPVGTVNGAAVRLYPVDSHIGIAEGIETGIAAHQIFNIPVWAAISAGGMKTFEPSEEIKEVTIFGDNDRNFTGQHVAYDLANRLSLKGITANVRIPDAAGRDWADVLLHNQEVVLG